MTLPIYIISLASATHRRTYQQDQAQRLGFEPVWHSAVGVNDIADEDFRRHAFRWQRPLKKTEFGCFLSHWQLWQLIAQSGGPAVVLEDDVMLGGEWFQDVQTLAALAQADFICLETWGKKILGAKQQVGGLVLQKLILNSAGAAGYVLWPKGAKRLLDRFQSDGPALADAFINQITGWSAWQLVPANVVQMNVAPNFGLVAPAHSESLIAREAHASPVVPNAWVLIQIKSRRLKGELRKAWIRLCALLIAKREFVAYLSHRHL